MIIKQAVLVKNSKINLMEIKLKDLKKTCCRIKINSTGICSSDIQRSFGNGAYFYPLVMGHEIS